MDSLSILKLGYAEYHNSRLIAVVNRDMHSGFLRSTA